MKNIFTKKDRTNLIRLQEFLGRIRSSADRVGNNRQDRELISWIDENNKTLDKAGRL